ncbi:MAG: alpha-1,2-fucosyltransferase, partial [Lactobacillales bacterium]|nr:alpha-1,2-fucosyltransferase [Lactobacillales bacterium]
MLRKKESNKKIIVLKLMGGLGNQLFEYSFALAVAKKNNARILIDVGEYKDAKSKKYVRDFELGKYFSNIDNNLFDIKEISKLNFMKFEICKKVFSTIKLSESFFKKNNEKIFKFFKFFGMNFCEHGNGVVPLMKKKIEYAYGFFQNVRYVDPILEELKSNIKFTKGQMSANASNFLLQIQQAKNTVMIHIRRGDYVDISWLLCSRKYYVNAIEIIKQMLGKDLSIFVFSDDYGKAKELIGNDYNNLVWIENTSTCEDLYLMSQCKHFIIANS